MYASRFDHIPLIPRWLPAFRQQQAIEQKKEAKHYTKSRTDGRSSHSMMGQVDPVQQKINQLGKQIDRCKIILGAVESMGAKGRGLYSWEVLELCERSPNSHAFVNQIMNKRKDREWPIRIDDEQIPYDEFFNIETEIAPPAGRRRVYAPSDLAAASVAQIERLKEKLEDERDRIAEERQQQEGRR